VVEDDQVGSRGWNVFPSGNVDLAKQTEGSAEYWLADHPKKTGIERRLIKLRDAAHFC
jgi:hypothetical protein